MPLSSTPDHVAVAVPDLDGAVARWRDVLGGGVTASFHRPGAFRGRQISYRNGATLELLSPPEEGDGNGFLERFLDRHGSEVHHLTLLVPELGPAAEELGDVGLDVVDLDDSREDWHEAFLRPSQVGGLVVQIACAPRTGRDGAAHRDGEAERPRHDGAALEGPLLRHPDLRTAGRLWTLLGARVTRDAGGLMCRWPGAPLTVRIVPASPAGPLGLRFAGSDAMPPDDDLGAAVIPAPSAA